MMRALPGICAAGLMAVAAATVAHAAPDTNGPDGSTPLQWAVYRNDIPEVKRLLQAGAKVGEANNYGATPMQMAAATGNAQIIKLLLDAGANADSPNAEGQTALMAVARTGNVEAAKLLLRRGAKVNARESWGDQTALMWASARRHPQMMELLISHGADINARSAWRNWERHVTAESRAKRTNAGGLTPLMYAARENCLECVNVLIKHHVDVDLPDPDGVAPMTVAILNTNWDIAKRLIEAGADVNQWDIYGEAPLISAIDLRNRIDGGRASIDAPNTACDPRAPRTVPPQAFVGPIGLEDRLDALIDGAQHSIDLQMYLFNDRTIATHLVSAAQRGVTVRAIFDAQENGNDAVRGQLMAAGIDVM